MKTKTSLRLLALTGAAILASRLAAPTDSQAQTVGNAGFETPALRATAYQ